VVRILDGEKGNRMGRDFLRAQGSVLGFFVGPEKGLLKLVEVQLWEPMRPETVFFEILGC
jgi:hypothetical protein